MEYWQDLQDSATVMGQDDYTIKLDPAKQEKFWSAKDNWQVSNVDNKNKKIKRESDG